MKTRLARCLHDISLTQQLLNIMNLILTMEFALYFKTWNAHLNVRGSNFSQLHQLFKEQYEELFEITDDVAEHLMMIDPSVRIHGDLGYFSTGGGILTPKILDCNKPEQFLFLLCRDHQSLIDYTIDGIKIAEMMDQVAIADLLIQINRKHKKMQWILESHLS